MSGDLALPGARVLHIDAPEYPEHLRLTPGPPKRLHVLGDASLLLTPSLAVIGARRATPYGLECARLFASHAAGLGVTVVSGAAAGCDRAAQLAAIEAGGRSVAVLGGGADVDYPPGSARLLAELRHSGAVVSESPWRTAPLPWMFRRRNRIIAGLAAAVLVVEAGLPSGTFSTADHAIAAGREVLVVPGSIFFAGCAGCNRLLVQGAQPIVCPDDLTCALERLGLVAESRPHTAGDDGRGPALRDVSALDGAMRRIAEALLADPMSPESLASACGTGPAETARTLSVLEARGLVRRYQDGRYGPG